MTWLFHTRRKAILPFFAGLFACSNVLAQSSAPAPIESPRLLALERQLQAGKANALEDFWQEIARTGAPLIEPVPGDARHSRVTFLWRGRDTRSVALAYPLNGFDVDSSPFTRLADTDLWFRTELVENDVRTTYRFAVNQTEGPLTRDNWAARSATWITDPLNPRLFPTSGDPDLRRWTVSPLEMPAATPQPWARKNPEAAVGRLEEHLLKSERLNVEKRIHVHLPAGYSRTRSEPYPLVVLFDGAAYLHLVPTPMILDNLIGGKAIPAAITVFVDNPLNIRGQELPCNPAFAAFLATELIPWVRSRYHVTTDAQRTVVAGSSHGGLAATYAGFRYSQIFGKVLSQSASFWWKPASDTEQEWLTRQFAAADRLPLDFYVDVGTFESGRAPSPYSQLAVNRRFRDALRSKGYSIHYAEFRGGHDYFNWQGTLADGLIVLLGVAQSAAQNTSKDQGRNAPWEGSDVDRMVRQLESVGRPVFRSRTQLASFVSPRKGSVVADVGAGSGFMAELFAEQVGPTGKVYAVEVNPGLVEHLSNRFRRNGRQNVEALLTKSDSLDLPANSVDLVFLCLTYRFMEKPHESLVAIHRSLRSGGELVIVEAEDSEFGSREQLIRDVSAAGFTLVRNERPAFLPAGYFALRLRK